MDLYNESLNNVSKAKYEQIDQNKLLQLICHFYQNLTARIRIREK